VAEDVRRKNTSRLCVTQTCIVGCFELPCDYHWQSCCDWARGQPTSQATYNSHSMPLYLHSMHSSHWF